MHIPGFGYPFVFGRQLDAPLSIWVSPFGLSGVYLGSDRAGNSMFNPLRNPNCLP